MNRLILKYGTPITVVIVAIFAWVIYRRIADGGVAGIIPLAVTAVAVWALGAFLFIYFWPRITVGGFKRIITKRGFGGGPIPVTRSMPCPRVRRSPHPPAASSRRGPMTSSTSAVG